MTVRIITPGVLPEHKEVYVTCRHCSCQFAFNPPDARSIYDQRDGSFYIISCPTCGHQVTATI